MNTLVCAFRNQVCVFWQPCEVLIVGNIPRVVLTDLILNVDADNDLKIQGKRQFKARSTHMSFHIGKVMACEG